MRFLLLLITFLCLLGNIMGFTQLYCLLFRNGLYWRVLLGFIWLFLFVRIRPFCSFRVLRTACLERIRCSVTIIRTSERSKSITVNTLSTFWVVSLFIEIRKHLLSLNRSIPILIDYFWFLFHLFSFHSLLRHSWLGGLGTNTLISDYVRVGSHLRNTCISILLQGIKQLPTELNILILEYFRLPRLLSHDAQILLDLLLKIKTFLYFHAIYVELLIVLDRNYQIVSDLHVLCELLYNVLDHRNCIMDCLLVYGSQLGRISLRKFRGSLIF